MRMAVARFRVYLLLAVGWQPEQAFLEWIATELFSRCTSQSEVPNPR